MNIQPMDLSAQKPGTVLVVDDEDFNRQLLRDPLEARGYTIFEACSGDEALHLAQKHLPDTILLDVMMPNMDGFQVCRRLKENAETAGIPIIMVTALTDRKERMMGIQSGANDFLAKPVDITDVVLRVRNAVQIRRLYGQLQKSFQRHTELESVRDKLVQMMLRELCFPLQKAIHLVKPVHNSAAERLATEEKAALDRAIVILDGLDHKLKTAIDLSAKAA